MGRTDLFEIHDHPWFPAFLRDLVTDALQAVWNFGNLYRPILPLLWDALSKAAAKEVLDLCSGGGGPWHQLIQDLERDLHFPISVCLSDKYPNQEAFRRAVLDSDAKIGFDPRSVQATDVPADQKGFRTMFSSFHHFRVPDARKVLADAVQHRKGIAIFEMVRREPKTMLANCFIADLVSDATNPPLPLVVAALDVCAPCGAIRAVVRWLDVLPACLFAGRTW
jgi:hypothetical protein